MKTISYIILFGILWFFLGYLIGSRPVQPLTFAQHQSEQFAILDQSAELSGDLNIASNLHHGDTEKALHSIVLRFDANLVSLADKQDLIFDETNLNKIFDYALNFRKTNFWMNDYGFNVTNTNGSNSFLTIKLQQLLSKP